MESINNLNSTILETAKIKGNKIALIENKDTDGTIVFTVCVERSILFIFKYWSIIKSYIVKDLKDYNIQRYNAYNKFNRIKNGKF